MTAFTDEALVLRVENRNDADKFITCFTKSNGRVRFVAYGARYQKSVSGRILQPFSHLNVELSGGNVLDRLQSCELASVPVAFDYKQLAYAGVLAELTEVFTADHVPDESLFFLLQNAFSLLKTRNPRIVVLAYATKLLLSTGFNPQMHECVLCHNPVQEKMFFSSSSGGMICEVCPHTGMLEFDSGARELFFSLQNLDLENPGDLVVRGKDLMQLEGALHQFIVFQTDKKLNSLAYLQQIGL